MATPHISGAMALLWSAIPSLRHQIDASRDSFEQRGTFYFFHPVRHSRPPKQRVWMGPGRYICGCERRITHANTYSDSYSDTNGNSDANSNSNAHRYSDGHSYSYSNAQTHAHAQVCADTEASSHTAAATLEIFAGAKFPVIGDE